MDDDAFERFMVGLEDGSIRLALIAPINNPAKLDTERNLDLAEKLGHEFFERIWMDGQNGAPSYLSNEKYLVVSLPLRRQAQFLVKKITIPKNSRTVDRLTGQPTGESKGSKISYPELLIMAARGHDDTVTEFIKLRGGDTVAFNALMKSITQTGGASLAAIESLGTQVKSTVTVSTILTAMHLENRGLTR